MSSDVEVRLRGPGSYDLARKAVAAMEQHSIWPTAVNFELWTHVVADPQGPLAKEIERIISGGESFTDNVADELAAAFLPKAKLNEQIRDAGDARADSEEHPPGNPVTPFGRGEDPRGAGGLRGEYITAQFCRRDP